MQYDLCAEASPVIAVRRPNEAVAAMEWNWLAFILIFPINKTPLEAGFYLFSAYCLIGQYIAHAFYVFAKTVFGAPASVHAEEGVFI